MDNFDCTFYQARLAKKIVEDKGVMSSPNAKARKSLSEDTVTFYYHDDISRVMPGKKDFVSVRNENGEYSKSTRLVLCNLREAYKHSKHNIQVLRLDSLSLLN